MKHILLTTAIVGLMAGPGFAEMHDGENGNDDAVIENGEMPDAEADVEVEAEGEIDADTGADVDADVDAGADMEVGTDAEGEAAASIDVGELSADDLMGADVMSVDDERVGSVDDAVLDGEGAIESILFDVGGFLGIGARTVAVDVADFDIVEVDGELQVMLDLTEEQIEELPEHEE